MLKAGLLCVMKLSLLMQDDLSSEPFAHWNDSRRVAIVTGYEFSALKTDPDRKFILPNYPKENLDAKIEGKVMVIFSINKAGELTQLTFESEPYNLAFEVEVERIMRLNEGFWRVLDKRGNAVNGTIKLPLIFKLPERLKNDS